MKTTKKLTLLLIIIMTLIISSIGAYAWLFVGSDKVNEMKVELDSTRIFEASMTTKVNNEEIQYYDDKYYDRETHLFTFDNPNELANGFSVDVTIEAKKQIKVRFKIVEEWRDLNGNIIKNPNKIKFETTNPNIDLKDNDQYLYYSKNIQKNEIIENIEIISSATIKETITNNSKLYFAVIVEAIQYNYENTWDKNPNDTLANTITLNKPTTVEVEFSNVFQVGILRGVLIEFIQYNKNIKYQFVYGETRNNFSVSLEAGTYDINVYTHKLFKYDIKFINDKLVITISYRPIKDYIGIHSFIFSPNIIREFKLNTYYPEGTIVYTVDDKGTKTYWISKKEISSGNTQTPETKYSGWEIMGKRWNQGNVIDNGKVVYYNNTFWQSTTNGNGSTPGSVNSNWKRLDNIWFLNNTYNIGDVIMYDGSYWLTVTNGNNYTNPGSSESYDKFTMLGYTFNPNARSSYKSGDIVLVNGIYYQVLGSGWRNPSTDTDGNDGWITLGMEWDYEKVYKKGDVVSYKGSNYELINNSEWGQKPTDTSFWKKVSNEITDEWKPNKIYSSNDYVTLNGESYIVKENYNNIQGENMKPGSSVYWRKLTENFDEYNMYKEMDRYSLVFYNDAWWQWTYEEDSDQVKQSFEGKNPTPGTIVNGKNYWQEVTITWRAHNRYKENDMVIFAGYFWRAKKDINEYVAPGDVMYWERYDIDWNPNK